MGISQADGGFLVKRQGDSGQEMVAAGAGCLITCSNDMNEPRIPKLKGIMASKKKPLKVLSLRDLGVSEGDVAPKHALPRMEKYRLDKLGRNLAKGPRKMRAG